MKKFEIVIAILFILSLFILVLALPLSSINYYNSEVSVEDYAWLDRRFKEEPLERPILLKMASDGKVTHKELLDIFSFQEKQREERAKTSKNDFFGRVYKESREFESPPGL